MKLSLLIKFETSQKIQENYIYKVATPTVLNSKRDIRKEG